MRLALVLVLVAACSSKSEPKPKPVASGSAPVPVAIDAAAPADLATTLAAIRDRNKLPALAVVAWRDGKLIEEAVVGVRKLGATTPATLADKWHLGSNTKAMTALLVGIYVDKGTLRWTDTIGQILGGKIDAGYKDVTLDQLLRHAGGAPGDLPKELGEQLQADGDKPDARIKFVRGVLATPPAQKPGEFTYSNTGYMIAAAMLEKKTGKRWEDLLRADVFDKLGMASCGFGAPLGDQPWGHDKAGKSYEPGPEADNPPGLGPAGTVHCALGDYGKFLNVFATSEPALVTPETMQHLRTARGEDGKYAGGWMVLGGMLLHSGSNTLWYATAAVNPAKRFAFALATNKGEDGVEGAIFELLARYAQ